jgi:hypothetical protein
VLSPYLAWNYHHMGTLFPSYSGTYFMLINGMARARFLGDEVLYRPLNVPLSEVVPRVARNALTSALSYARNIFDTVGPGALLLVPVGLWHLWKQKRPVFYCAVLIVLCQMAISSTVGIFRQRFSVPVIPIIFLLAAVGAGALLTMRWWWQGAAGVLALFAIGQQSMLLYLDYGKFYTQSSARRQYTYEKMRKLVKQMRSELKPGLVVGAAKLGDGGLETVYWLDWPYGREMYGPKITPKLAKDFDAKYIWCDTQNLPLVKKWVPGFTQVLSNELFVVLARDEPKPRPELQPNG